MNARDALAVRTRARELKKAVREQGTMRQSDWTHPGNAREHQSEMQSRVMEVDMGWLAPQADAIRWRAA